MFVVLRTDVKQDKCTEPNNAWDDDKSRCMDLLTWNGADDSTLGGGNDLIANRMWKSWNMDPYWTMKNAVTCWEEHDGHIGDVEPRRFGSLMSRRRVSLLWRLLAEAIMFVGRV
ncbi:hypothetical protein Q7P35_003337 [Cladosporium inversicolor]